MGKNKKGRQGMVYSTNPDFDFEYESYQSMDTLPKAQQCLYISIDKKNRKGKSVTLISGFVGSQDALKDLGRSLKIHCGSGGSIQEGQILVQGDFREKIINFLQKEGYQVKRKGG